MLQIHMFDASNHHVPWFLHRFHQFSMVNSQFSVIFGTQKWPMNPTSSCPPSSSPPSDPVAPPRPAPPPPWRRRPDGTTGRPLYWWILSANWGIQICFLLNLFVWEIVVVYQYIYIYIYICTMGRGLGVSISYSSTLILYSTSIFYGDLFIFILSISDHLPIGWFSWEASNQPTSGKRTSMGVPVSLENSMNERMNKGRKDGKKEGRKEQI